MTSSLHARSAIGAVALFFATLVAGCDEEDPASPSAAETTPAASTPPSEPTRRATEPVRAPLAIVRAWVSAYNTTLRDGDADELAMITGAGCETCAALRASVEDVYRAGGFFRGGRWTIDAAEVTSRSSRSIKVTAGITAAAGTSKDKRTAEPEPYPEDKFLIEFAVGRADGHQVVTRMVFLS